MGVDRGQQLIHIEIFFITISWITVALRIYVRTFIVKAFGWDDGWIIFAQLMHTMNVTCAIGGAVYGTGRLMKNLTPHGMMMALRFWWICYMSYCLTMIGAKVSVGLSLLRITPITKRTYRIIIHTVVYTTVITGLVFALLTTFQCNPVPYFWNRALGATGTCISMEFIVAFTYVMSVVFATCDFTFAILPVFLIKGLNMSRNSKIALIPILSMACIASAAVIVRLAYIPTFRDPEFLYATVPIAIWSEVEMSLAITAGSLPTLRPLYRVAARQFNWKTNIFSTQRSYGMMPDGTKKGPTVGGVSRQESCSESERNIVHVREEEFALEERRRDEKEMRITKITNVQVKFEDKKF
ncbi:hypothetical protein BKA66DRAFT_478340 [Pyrenochaeta sp. MPI-SDFR-AT-0127]|nr:hypothetical protein BKA66DRAFT_478340 [Pyrenochaeta sp. MPI-SDFR-AT-0127]